MGLLGNIMIKRLLQTVMVSVFTAPLLISQAPQQVPRMPGRLVATDAGHRLHVWCTGEGSTTVILLNGGGGFSIDWAVIQPAVAAKTRVCSYDRAGYAWSDPGPEPRSLGTSIAELHQMLTRADVHPPYVLVGSSWGGLIASAFAQTHSNEVTGVVLVDVPSLGTAAVAGDLLMNLDPRAEEEPPPIAPFPADLQGARAWAKSRLPTQILSLEASGIVEQELAFKATAVGNRVPLGDTPLVVISAGRVSWDAPTRASAQSYTAVQRAHIENQAYLAGLSRNSKFVVARASFHAVQFYEPEVITNAIVQVLASRRP
jgi:pimeloyl-ACP methyl ester carboxylesterase